MIVYSERFSKFIPRLRGMHLQMSFVGCIGKLMTNSGLEEIMKHAFGGVAKMLIGKKYPQNCRSLRLILEGLLGDILDQVDNYDAMMSVLKE